MREGEGPSASPRRRQELYREVTALFNRNGAPIYISSVLTVER